MPDRKVGRTVVDGPQLRSLLVKMVRAMSANEIAEVLLEAYGPVKCATIADALREERERDGKAERELAALRERVRSGACCHKCGQAVLDPACIFCGAPHTPPEPTCSVCGGRTKPMEPDHDYCVVCSGAEGPIIEPPPEHHPDVCPRGEHHRPGVVCGECGLLCPVAEPATTCKFPHGPERVCADCVCKGCMSVPCSCAHPS